MSKKERLSKEDRLKLEDFVDSIELGVVKEDGSLEPYNGLFGVWEVPILGHMVILNTKEQ